MNLFEEIISLPSSVSAYGWIPFVVAILLTMGFSTLYVKYFWSRSDREKCSVIISILGLTIALLSALLLPVDVFLVSFMKNPDGTFKEWANNSTRQAVEDSVAYTYYSLYGIIFFYTFFILPLAYFSYEERDEDRRNNYKVFTTALMYTFVFIMVVSALLIAGIFIPFKAAPPKNTTDWEKVEFMLKELYQNRGKDALSFVINVLTIYGMINLILYTSVGMASFPITMIKGFRSLSDEEFLLSNNQANTQSKINALRSKQARKQLTSREITALAELEEEENLISRRSSVLEAEKKKLTYKCAPFLRFINVTIGGIALIFSLVLFISLLIVNIDKLMNSLGVKMGYVLKENLLPNPMDYVMVQAQKIFPIDYILFFGIIIFFVTCTVSGIRYLGICCFCIPMYKIRPGGTPPQGLIMLAFILMFSVLAFHILMYSVLPTYTTFGSQNYCNQTISSNVTCDLKKCTLDSPPDDCIMTRGAAFFLTFAYKAWIFAATYYWMTWIFLAVFVISFAVACIRSQRSSLEEAVDKDDFDDSDDHCRRI